MATPKPREGRLIGLNPADEAELFHRQPEI